MATDRRVPFMIGVAGGTASGKSTVCERLMEGLGQNEVSVAEKQVRTCQHLASDDCCAGGAPLPGQLLQGAQPCRDLEGKQGDVQL